MHKIAIVSEGINFNPTEGIRKFSQELAKALEQKKGLDVHPIGYESMPSSAVPRFFWKILSIMKIRGKIRRINPDAVIYVTSSPRITINLLKFWLWADKIEKRALILLQRQRGEAYLAKRILADASLFLQFDESLLQKRIPRDHITLIPSGVDTEVFVPATIEKKREMKAQLGIEPSEKVVLSVGHPTVGRKLETFVNVSKRIKARFVFVSSDLHTNDPAVMDFLETARIMLITQPLARIQDIYAAADCYLFTTEREDSAIGVPLSIFEAMAVNIPVVTTDFSIIRRILDNPPEQKGLFFFEDEREAEERIERALAMKDVHTRSIALDFKWEFVADKILQMIE